MWELLRKFPHPVQGQCGGASRDCSKISDEDFNKLPWIQRAYATHDRSLDQATTREERQAADYILAKGIRAGDPRTLTWWGRIYRHYAKKFFK